MDKRAWVDILSTSIQHKKPLQVCFVGFKRQKCRDLCVFLGVKSGLKILVRVKDLTFCNCRPPCQPPCPPPPHHHVYHHLQRSSIDRVASVMSSLGIFTCTSVNSVLTSSQSLSYSYMASVASHGSKHTKQ